MASAFLSCDFRKCFWVSVVIIFMLPYYFALLHRVGPVEEAQFAKAQQVLTQQLAECGDLEKRELLEYTLRRYDRLGPFDVAVCPTFICAGANVPWCPGITIDVGFMNNPEILAGIILHEAMHDYLPCFGHTRHEQLGVW
jgi:hypothetical protein